MKARWTAFAIFFLLAVFAKTASSEDVNLITKEELKPLLENPDVIIVDVRYPKHWTESDLRIKGAVREDYGEVKSWADKYPKDKPIIVYCA